SFTILGVSGTVKSELTGKK
ncbi:hypothetical protein ACLCDG_07570, partial [Coxiella burnetii]